MGKTIVSWSPVHGQGATTANTVSLASLFAIEYKLRTLLTHTQLSYSSMEYLLGKNMVDEKFEQTGIKALERLMKSRLLKSEAVEDYTETIYRNRLDMLGGTSNGNNKDLLNAVIDVTSDVYDSVWIDAHSGQANEFTTDLLERADFILINLPQNQYILEDFFADQAFFKQIKNKPHAFLISQYDKEANVHIKKIKRKYHLNAPVYPVPYCKDFKNACNSQQVSQFFIRHYSLEKASSAFEFINALMEVNACIAKQFGLSLSIKEEDDQ